MLLNVKLFADTGELLKMPFVELLFEPFLAKHVTKNVLQVLTVACGIAEQDFAHHPPEHEHTGEHIAAVGFVYVPRDSAIQASLVTLAAPIVTAVSRLPCCTAGGVEPPLSDWKLTFRTRKPVCCRYTTPAKLSVKTMRRFPPWSVRSSRR